MSCPQCFKGGIHNHAKPQGHMTTLYGKSCYIAEKSGGSTSESQILFCCDAFSLKLVNNKLLADRYAQDTGCKVIVPDIVPGGGADLSLFETMDNLTASVAWSDFWGQLKRVWAGLNAVYFWVPFLYFSSPAGAYPSVLQFARAMRKDLSPGGKMGVCGFCWGGYQSTKLCAEPAVEGGTERLIDAQYCAHPSALDVPQMVVDAVAKYKVPYYMAIGDKDLVMSQKTVLNTEAAVREKVGPGEEHDWVIKIYKGCLHGFVARAQPGNTAEIEAAEDSTKEAIEWWKKYLK